MSEADAQELRGTAAYERCYWRAISERLAEWTREHDHAQIQTYGTASSKRA